MAGEKSTNRCRVEQCDGDSQSISKGSSCLIAVTDSRPPAGPHSDQPIAGLLILRLTNGRIGWGGFAPLGVEKDGLGRSWCAGTPAERGGDTVNPFFHPTGKSQSRDACDHQTVVWTIPCGRREGRKVVLGGQVIPSRVSRFYFSPVLVWFALLARVTVSLFRKEG